MHIFLVDICPHVYIFCVVFGIRYNHFLSFFFLIKVELIYNVVLIVAVVQS